MNEEERALLHDTPLLSAKPVIFAANLSEADLANAANGYNAYYQKVMEIAKTENAQVIPVCAKIEEEIAELDDEDKQMFLDELGLKASTGEEVVVDEENSKSTKSSIRINKKNVES